ncbi:diguanylate cyclase domain-containing protein [Marinitoga litoralis]|jgi:GGDEF domain-containing protein|uniref:diguanylate cyclase domain-containing protein n=1 Tax=Marinitoga litoralis TaxID=570855 RepID=UPI00195F4C6F|nr:diguanylate cyclase [Marinitoga litoralis]MBM7559835.1 GGDEF domain-containing protein [Marinitoga litoralis]
MDNEIKVKQLLEENNKLREELEKTNRLLEEYNEFSKEEISAYKDFVEGFVDRKYIDSSTRVYSREFFDKIFFLLLETAFEKGNNYGLLIIKIPELEDLKYDGETHKSPEMEIGRVLRNNVRLPLDIIMRYSKTTFSIIIPDITEIELSKISDRIIYQLKSFVNNPDDIEYYEFYLPRDLTTTKDILNYFA